MNGQSPGAENSKRMISFSSKRIYNGKFAFIEIVSISCNQLKIYRFSGCRDDGVG